MNTGFKSVLIQGSARKDGHSQLVVNQLLAAVPMDQIHLADYQIGHYDYAYTNQGDDFLPLFRRLVHEYDLMLLSTPVYWYSMSGRMKVFLDRITDCLKIDKPTGRQLKGKMLGAISIGSEKTEVSGFFEPFRLTAGYLDMRYLGDLHTWVEDRQLLSAEVQERIDAFATTLQSLS